jgi:hypothetical protein
VSVPRSLQRVRGARRCGVGVLLGLCTTLIAALPAAAVESGPQGVVRQFCQADALGHRVTVRGWPEFMPIVSWPFEPAWDSVVLITGYTVGSPRPAENGALEVDVRYDVVGQVSALGLDTGVHVETVTFRVHAPEEGWRIIGPPPPPHLFGARADIELMQRSFERGALNFLPNSLFIWQMFRSAGWNVAFQRTTDLLGGTAYRIVEKPQTGDVVVYLRDGVAYHAGLLEAENRVVSSTLNAGIVRSAVDAFPGEVRYLRLIKPAPEPTPVVTTPARPARIVTPAVVKKPVAKPTPPKGATHGAQPSARHRVKTTGRGVRTPVAPGTPR